MAWKCCGICRLAVADDDETPFSEREDMSQSNGRWDWSFTTVQRGIYLRASRRVTGAGGFLGVTLRHKIASTIFHDQTFALFWNDGYRGREKPFLYCGATMDAGDAASIICCPVPPGSPPVDAVEIICGDYSPFRDFKAAYVSLVLYDADGKEIARKSVAIPLAVYRDYYGFRVEGITFADFERVEVGVLRSPENHCCPPVPRHQCDHYEYTSGQLNYLARPIFFRQLVNTVHQYLRAETTVKARFDSGLAILWQFGMGDCCSGIRFRIEVSGPDSYRRVLVSLIKECQHGGPVVIRQSVLFAGNWQPPSGEVEVPINVCIAHTAVRFGDPPEYYFDNVIAVDTPWGYVSWTGVFGFIDWSTDCAYNLGGFLYSSLMVVDVSCGSAASVFTRAALDDCACQAYPTPQPGISECLNLICTGAPAKRDPPDGWLVSVNNLPDEFQLIDWPQPVGKLSSNCRGTTECTGAWMLLCGMGDICDENPNRWPEEVAAMVNYVATHSSVPSGFPFATCDVSNQECVDIREYPYRNARVTVDIYVPIATIDVFEYDGKWPVFARVRAFRAADVPYNYQGYIERCSCDAFSEVLLAGMVDYPFCSGSVTLSEVIYSFGTKCHGRWCRYPELCDDENLEPPNLQGVTVTLTAVNE